MILLILIMGCLSFLFIGVGFFTWAATEIQEDCSDVKNITMLLVGIGIIAFGSFCTYRTSAYYIESENPKTEIVTSVPPQIDTIITTGNNVSDTTYIYKFNPSTIE